MEFRGIFLFERPANETAAKFQGLFDLTATVKRKVASDREKPYGPIRKDPTSDRAASERLLGDR